MKLSNKILLAFFGFIFLYLTAAFVEVRVSGTPNIINDKNSIAETVDISGVTYLIINDVLKDVKVIGSDRSQLEVRSFSGDVLKKLKYTISGDTLTLSGFESDDSRRVQISIAVPNARLKRISVKSSILLIESLQQNYLQISANDGRILMVDNSLVKLDLEMSNKSQLDVSKTNFDTLAVEIKQSQAFISSPGRFLQGSLRNNSILHLNDIEEIQLKKDESSRLTLYQN
jgi:hypothetical protein